MMKHETDVGQGGFTLIEVLIASVLLAMLILSVGFFFTNIIKQSDIVDDQTRAMELARQGLEEIRTMDVQSMPIGETTVESIFKFNRYFVIAEADPLYPNARQVTCILYWSSASGPDTLSFSTIF